MTLEERIERAAKDHWAHVESLKRLSGGEPRKWSEGADEERQQFKNLLGWHLRAAFPELFSSPPTHWLAPMEPTPEMYSAASNEVSHFDGDYGDYNVHFDGRQVDQVY